MKINYNTKLKDVRISIGSDTLDVLNTIKNLFLKQIWINDEINDFLNTQKFEVNHHSSNFFGEFVIITSVLSDLWIDQLT